MSLLLNKIGTLSIVAATLFGMSMGAHATNDANSATVNFAGKLIASTCTPSWSSKSSEIDFGEVSVTDFGSSVGSSAKSRDFTLSLSGCDESIQKVKVTASGTPDSAYADAYKNSGDATGVGIELKTGNEILSNGASHEFLVTDANTDMNFTAELVNTTSSAPVKGGVAGTVTLNMDYE